MQIPAQKKGTKFALTNSHNNSLRGVESDTLLPRRRQVAVPTPVSVQWLLRWSSPRNVTVNMQRLLHTKRIFMVVCVLGDSDAGRRHPLFPFGGTLKGILSCDPCSRFLWPIGTAKRLPLHDSILMLETSFPVKPANGNDPVKRRSGSDRLRCGHHQPQLHRFSRSSSTLIHPR